MEFTVLYGSECGTAESAAQAIVDALSAEGADVSLFDMLDFDVDDLDQRINWIVVSSTYGTGDLPTTAEPFYDALCARRPDLRGLRFAVFGLGDSVYETSFNRGGEIFAEQFVELGAAQVGEHVRHDASGSIDARDCARAWAATLELSFAAAPTPTLVG